MERDVQGRDDSVERVRAATDIVQLIGQYVNLKRAGRSFKGLCPFHSERTPSFMVSPDRQVYHCFGCNKGGDIFSFVMEHDGVSFVEALRSLGEKAGIEIESRKPRDAGRDPLYDTAERAARWYETTLAAKDGEPVRAYLRKRGVGPEIAERFRLGAAPNAWEDLGRALGAEGIAEEHLLALGLVSRRVRAGGTYDLFRNRLVIPVVSLSGRVVGFGGRSLPGGEDGETGPKYLNTPDSAIYHKGQQLYGLSAARGAIRRQEAVVITEGYLDVLTLFQAGIEHVVAACGTAFTPQQATLLHRYTGRAYILGDNDPAGRRAAVRTAGLLLEHGFLVYLVELPAGHDPDSFVREHGGPALETRLREAPSYVAYMKLLVDRRAGELAVKERVLRHVLSDLVRVPDPLLQELYGKEIGRTFGLSDAALANALERRRKEEAPKRGPVRVGAEVEPPAQAAQRDAERGLLRLALLGAPWLPRLVATLDAEDFAPGPARRLFETLSSLGDAEAAGAAGWLDRIDDDAERSLATRLEFETLPAVEPERLFEDYVATLRGARLAAAETDLRSRLAEAERTGDEAMLAQLLEAQRLLALDRSALRRRAPR